MRIIASLILLLASTPVIAAPDPLSFDSGAAFDSTLRLEERTDRYVLYEVRYPSPVHSPFPVNDTVWGHLYVPAEQGRPLEPARPCILFLPVMAAPNVWIEMRFVHKFVRKRYAVFLIETPYQFHRVPARLVPSGEAFLARTPDRLAANFRQSVLDARRAISWLQRSGKVDPNRVAIFGISLGAIVGSVVLSVDERLRGGIFLLGGADVADLLFHSSMTRDFIPRLGIDEDVLKKSLHGLDSLDYRKENRGKKVLLLNAWSDDIIPRANARALKAAFPGSGQIWLPFGHYTGMIHLLWVPAYIARQFRWVLGP